MSGVRSQLEIGNVMTSCILVRADGATTIPLNEETEVNVRLLFPDQFEVEFSNMKEARFFEGNRLVALGRFTTQRQSDQPPPAEATPAP